MISRWYLCHRSWAAETPDKYECDWKYLSYTFAKSKFPVTEKSTNWALVTPTPDDTSIQGFQNPGIDLVCLEYSVAHTGTINSIKLLTIAILSDH